MAASAPGPRRGGNLSDVGLIEKGALASLNGRLTAVGSMDDVMKSVRPTAGCVEIDAGGTVVIPGFVDCHTHAVFAGYRVEEYEWRLMGTPYEEIAKKGGGIAKSVSDLRAMDHDDLYKISLKRIKQIMNYGTTTIEIKSGYGLDLKNEVKQLRVIERLSQALPISVASTFLGAHAVPLDFAGRRTEYVDLLVNEMIPHVAREGLAEFIDVFSEKGVFDTGEAERILRAGQEAGLKARLHADELFDTSSAELAVKLDAVSADHLTKMSDDGLAKIASSSTIAVLLPGTSFGLPSLEFARARELIDSGAAVALATDFNPGSSPSESMPMMMSIACSFMRMSPAEALAACTYNPACVLGREDEVGSLETGKRTDFIILKAADYRELPYRFGINIIEKVFAAGRDCSSEARSRN